jgi:kinetochore protein NNF1
MPGATQPESRSPSPVPPPPIADTPGPRAQGLVNIYNQAVEATLKKCSTSNFASCFPTVPPETLEHLRSQVLNQLQRTWKLNFDEIMAKRNVVQLLNSLDRSIEDARLRKKRAEANGGPVETPVP